MKTTPKAAAKKAPASAAKPTKKPALATKPARKPTAASPKKPEAASQITREEIATRAYFIYVSAGCPEGQEMQHWLEAEAQLTLH
ncbi:DUF2934 domain-containing protein [Prosthecobacter sp.]|uniref:DUF2934 domain-containing protein n=1 Tax=Prosthecobacter sp. TaxID=1965333 RepID=UPI0024891C59|nr:DUF2934 domain-containing protein [Prosthecobacter sp.]MDI1313715.1 DUF2934 domain-containing protein [Prosthecobacter sp.]